jgi:hypothetical protein
MPIKPQWLDHEGFEMAGEKVGHEKRGHVIVPLRGENVIARVEGKAVWTIDAFNPVFFANVIQHAAGATIRVANEDAGDACRLGSGNGTVNRWGDLFGIVMKDSRKAFQVYVIKAELLADRQNFACDHPAGDDPNGLW